MVEIFISFISISNSSKAFEYSLITKQMFVLVLFFFHKVTLSFVKDYNIFFYIYYNLLKWVI